MAKIPKFRLKAILLFDLESCPIMINSDGPTRLTWLIWLHPFWLGSFIKLEVGEPTKLLNPLPKIASFTKFGLKTAIWILNTSKQDMIELICAWLDPAWFDSNHLGQTWLCLAHNFHHFAHHQWSNSMNSFFYQFYNINKYIGWKTSQQRKSSVRSHICLDKITIATIA